MGRYLRTLRKVARCLERCLPPTIDGDDDDDVCCCCCCCCRYICCCSWRWHLYLHRAVDSHIYDRPTTGQLSSRKGKRDGGTIGELASALACRSQTSIQPLYRVLIFFAKCSNLALEFSRGYDFLYFDVLDRCGFPGFPFLKHLLQPLCIPCGS